MQQPCFSVILERVEPPNFLSLCGTSPRRVHTPKNSPHLNINTTLAGNTQHKQTPFLGVRSRDLAPGQSEQFSQSRDLEFSQSQSSTRTSWLVSLRNYNVRDTRSMWKFVICKRGVGIHVNQGFVDIFKLECEMVGRNRRGAFLNEI